MKINLHEDNTTCIHCVRCGNHTMKTLERNFGCKVSWMNDVVMGPKQDGQGTGYVLVHTGSKHMSADIYTKGFTDKTTFGNLKQLICVFTPAQIESGDFDPATPGEEIPSEVSKWLNQHYHFLVTGDNTEVTDFRKPIKPKTPKATR